MLKKVKDGVLKLLSKYEGSISKVDYDKIKAHIDLLYFFALPYEIQTELGIKTLKHKFIPSEK